MRRWLGRFFRALTRLVVGYFPFVALLFLVFVTPVEARLLVQIAAALAFGVAGLLWFFSRRDPVLRQAIGLGSVLLSVAVLCGALLALSLAGWSPEAMWQTLAMTPTTAPTPPLRQGQLWRSAANEWLRGGGWPITPVSVPAPQPGTYAVAFERPLEAVVVIAPWGAPPRAAILLQAQARWEGLSAAGAWGVVCHYHEQRWTEDAARLVSPTAMPLGMLAPLEGVPEFYALVLSGDGFAAIWKHTVAGAWRLTPWTAALGGASLTPGPRPTPAPTPTPTHAPAPVFVPSPTPTPGLPRQRGQQDLHALCGRGMLQLYVNGRLVVQARDDDLAPGQVGLWAVAPPVVPWQVAWTQFRVYTLAAP